MDASERSADLADRIDDLSEELSDLAIDVLGEALQSSEEHCAQEAMLLEKRLNRARSALEKAAGLLRAAKPAGLSGN